MPVRGPWYITAAAVREYMAIVGLPDTDAGFAEGEERLVEAAIETVGSGRGPARMQSGALRYRGPRPERLTLVVVEGARPEGELPQLVRVMRAHRSAR